VLRRTRNLIAAFVSVAVLAGGVVLAADLVQSRQDLAQRSAATVSPSPSLLPSPSASPSAANDLASINADIGAVMVMSQSGSQMQPLLRSMFESGQAGGLLLFGSNFTGASQLKRWSDLMTSIAAQKCLQHPILVMLDEEGGQVNRIGGTFAPPSQLVAARGGADNVRALERASALGLRKLGVGLNLAPVADVRTNPKDTIILDRSFGSNPAIVAPLVGAAVQGLHDGGVGATLKHFPGLGGAAGDPHKKIPTDPTTEAQWMRVQLPAFQAGVDAGADAVMTTAVYVPGLGAGNLPAMFSPAVVSRLRTELGFQGVIMTDSVSMGGIGVKWTLPQAAVLALAAGNDMVLLGNASPAYERQAIAAVRAAVLSGRIDRAQLHASALRVNALRDKWGMPFTHC